MLHDGFGGMSMLQESVLKLFVWHFHSLVFGEATSLVELEKVWKDLLFEYLKTTEVGQNVFLLVTHFNVDQAAAIDAKQNHAE